MGNLQSKIALATNKIKKALSKKKESDTTALQTTQSLAPTPSPAAQLERNEPQLQLPQPQLQGAPSTEAEEGSRQLHKDAQLPSTSHTPPLNTPTSKPAETEMASDEDYAAFLDKANQDPNEGVRKSQSSGKIQLKAVDEGVQIPAALKKAVGDAFYVSDADEPFEVVGLKAEGGLPDEATFAKLVNHPNAKDADVSILDIGEWDPQGQYKEVVDATRKATKGSDVRVYRIGSGGARAEYWVVGVTEGKMLGVKALAVES